jgi:TRAP-type C4-dicarboxylate transport system permease small subunit
MDLRTPIGYLFTLVGLILTGWGLFGDASTHTKAGDNINLWWGVAILVFGLVMGFFARRASKCAAAEEKKSCGTGCGCK